MVLRNAFKDMDKMPSGNVSVDHLCMQVGSMELHKDKKTINEAVSHISSGRDSLTLDEFLDLMYHLLSTGTVARVAGSRVACKSAWHCRHACAPARVSILRFNLRRVPRNTPSSHHVTPDTKKPTLVRKIPLKRTDSFRKNAAASLSRTHSGNSAISTPVSRTGSNESFKHVSPDGSPPVSSMITFRP